MDIDYREVLDFLIAKFGYCRIVDASINPHKYGLTLSQAMDIGTTIYVNYMLGSLRKNKSMSN